MEQNVFGGSGRRNEIPGERKPTSHHRKPADEESNQSYIWDCETLIDVNGEPYEQLIIPEG
jgi:hypothetical protein